METIGILLPRSTYYAGLSFDMFEGFRSSLNHLGLNEIRIVTENIGFGTDKQQCYKSAEQLIMHENAKIVFAYIGHRMAQVLRPLFQASNRILVVMDAGVNVPQEWPESPNIIYHSLHNALGSWLTAKRAVRDGYSTAGMVTGYYDGGYLHTWGLASGYDDAGGSISFNHATGYSQADFTMEPLKEHMEQFPKSALLSIFSGDYVQWYFEGLKDVFGDQQLPVYLPPFGMEESMLEQAVYPGDNARGIAAWSKQIENKENKEFIDVIETAGRTPNLFSLLGWESAIIAKRLLELLKENNNHVQRSSDGINDFSFESPRGKVTFHPGTRTSIAPLYEARLEKNDTGNCTLRIESVITETETEFEKFIEQSTENAISGWYNSYTCI